MSTANLFSRIVSAMAGVLATLVSAVAFGQSYPTRPIELVVHTSAGSGTDVVARAVAEVFRREKLLPQPFVVVNKVGGQDIYMGSAEFSQFLAKRLAEARDFYNAIGLGAKP